MASRIWSAFASRVAASIASRSAGPAPALRAPARAVRARTPAPAIPARASRRPAPAGTSDGVRFPRISLSSQGAEDETDRFVEEHVGVFLVRGLVVEPEH